MTAVIAVIGFIVFVVIVYLIKTIPYFIAADMTSKNLFVCQTCGHEFYPRWQEMVLGRWILYTRGEIKLCCPRCGRKEWCSEKRK